MKIYAFEVRADEMEYFEQLAAQFNVEIEINQGNFSISDLDRMEPGSAITSLGQSSFKKDALTAMKEHGINYLSTRTIGYNHIDIEAAKELGIHVCNANYAPNGVADYTIMMILLCLRHYKQILWRIQVNDYSLPGLMGMEMRNLTIGVMGTGRIGATVIKSLSGFGCRILAYDKFENEEVKQYATYVSLDELYKESDVITLHMPLLPDTYHIIDHDAIQKMKDGVVLINCARGPLMDIQSLIDNIENEKIGALGLDCLENEEGIIHINRKTDIFSNREMAYLRQFKNVVYTQHIAFYTDAAVKSMVQDGVVGLIEMNAGNAYPRQIC